MQKSLASPDFSGSLMPASEARGAAVHSRRSVFPDGYTALSWWDFVIAMAWAGLGISTALAVSLWVLL